MNGMMTGVLLGGTKAGNKRMTRFGYWCHQSSEAVRMGENELGHRTCSEHIPVELSSEGAGDGRFYRTASGAWIPDGGA